MWHDAMRILSLGVKYPVPNGFLRLLVNNMTPELITCLLPSIPIPEYLKILIGKVHHSVSGHHAFNVRYLQHVN